MRAPSLLLCSALLLGSAHAADLSGVKTYLDRHISTQISGAATLKQAADTYYAAAKAANFNYRALSTQPATRATLQAARTGWQQASPAYENIEGIVAGVPTLASFDLNLDAGTSSGEDAVTFDLTLPGGKVLKKPGNLFGVTEGTLWGTVPAYRAGVPFDVNGNGRADFDDQLPDALVLKAAADALHTQSLALQKAARAWTPTRADVFGALVGNVPTVGPVFFEDWKSSPFVLGTRSDRRDFVVISRLRDLQGNVASWRAMYAGLHGDVKAKDAALDTQISASLTELAAFVDRLVAREAQRRYTPEQAETLQREAQNRATVLTGRLSQAAARLGVTLP
ncbi:imelysin family protein [Deinococcus radiotolerans]|uniref:Efem/EfeO family lipoprotein n=1 Tax=Deinococcus radiotolerans TaxID=1309407 RepID=A0ABQ2FIU8_9DEIO|nr:imelysin family protein [Deinococcus radiotolerans]GGL00066.1 Efem/EfeO family lipoprotein [Deinococcus radiotolerans]